MEFCYRDAARLGRLGKRCGGVRWQRADCVRFGGAGRGGCGAGGGAGPAHRGGGRRHPDRGGAALGGEARGEPDAALCHATAELHGVRARPSPEDGDPLGLVLALAEVGARRRRVLQETGGVWAQLPLPHAHRHRFHHGGRGPGFPDFREAVVKENLLHSFAHTPRAEYVVELPDGTEIARTKQGSFLSDTFIVFNTEEGADEGNDENGPEPLAYARVTKGAKINRQFCMGGQWRLNINEYASGFWEDPRSREVLMVLVTVYRPIPNTRNLYPVAPNTKYPEHGHVPGSYSRASRRSIGPP
ncbi:hypothetical protein T484DRAFT_3086220 [Baffinella frigidus]|nr:hypothetical protein T484DRAFT_3086220 [Cryptophyta sp. CCMP2293]